VVKAIALAPTWSASGGSMRSAWRRRPRRHLPRAGALQDEMTRTMGLLGVNTLAELNPSYLRAAPSVRVPHVLSAFPYIDGRMTATD